jgi:hypothetical protein
MPLHESLEYFPLFDVELTGETPSAMAALGDGVAAIGSPDALGGAGALVIYCYSKARNGWGYVGVITGSKAPGPGQVRAMGSSVTAAGGTLIVGARGDATTPGKVFVLAAPYGVWSYTTIPVISELQRGGSAAGDLFGASIATCSDGDDDYIAVSAPGAAPPPGVPGPGQVFIFKGLGASPSPWSTSPIANPNPAGADTDRFGASLAVDVAGDGTLILAVGAPGTGQGVVYVGRTAEPGTWPSSFEFGPAIGPVFPVIEGAEDAFETTSFGTSVGLTGGSTLLIGAPDDPNFIEEIEGTGAVWIYKDVDGAFVQLDERLYGPAEGARFGHSLSLPRRHGAPHEAADELVVGAPGAAVAYRCRRNPDGDGFVREMPLVRISGKRPDGFGWSVAASGYQHGTWHLVVAPGDAKAGVDSGGFLYADGGDRPTWLAIPPLMANPPIRWGGLNYDWWKKFTPGIETYVDQYLAQPEEVRERALASAAEGLS